MKKLSPKALLALVLGGLLLYGALGYFVLVGPKKGKAAELDKEVTALRVELQAALAAQSAQGDAQPIAVADIFRVAKAMPSVPDMPGILLELSRIADETGIAFKSITPQASTTATGYQLVPISLVFDGTFYELSDFLFRLRTLVAVRKGELQATGRLFAVQSVDFAESPDGFPELTASLTVNAFVYGTDAPANEVPAPAAAPASGEAPAEGAAVPPVGAEATGTEATG